MAESDLIWEPNFYSIQNFSTNTEKKGYRNRESFSAQRMMGRFSDESHFAEVDIELNLVGNYPLGTWDFYLGRNANVSFYLPIGNLWIGRKEFASRLEYFSGEPAGTSPFPDYRNLDGGEGLGLDILYWENLVLQAFLWDYYRGYPIWQYNQTPVFNNSEKKDLTQGERYRQGIRFLYNSNPWQLEGDFFYLHIGNWGSNSKDDLSNKELEGGDGDNLYRFRIGLSREAEIYRLGIQYHLTRGLDKTFADPKRPERSMPIRGEAWIVELGFEKNDWNLNFYGFLPNTPQTNESIDPLTMGYVGMGNPNLGGNFLSRERNLYPSAWVTEHGLEWNRWDSLNIGGNRASAGLSRAELGWKNENYRAHIWGEYILPRSLKPHDKGQVSLKKQDYVKWFVAEAGIGLEMGDRDEYFSASLGMEFSYFWTQEDLGIRGNVLRVYGRYIF